MFKAAGDQKARLPLYMKDIRDVFLNRGHALFAVAFSLFVRVFPRPKLADQDQNRVASVLSDYFAISILYHGVQFLYLFPILSHLGMRNFTYFLVSLFVIRYLATKGKLKSSILVYSFSVAYFYITTSFNMQYLEHAQVSGFLIVIAFATLTLGAVFGFCVFASMTATLYVLMMISDSVGLATLRSFTDMAPPVNYEIQIVVTNMGKVFLLSALVRSHIFSQLTASIFRERGIAAKEEQARKEAEFANSEKTRFIASASHDLRQPVSTLALSFDSYIEDYPGAMNTAAMRNMGASIDTLSKMLESILTVSKLQANVIKPIISKVCVDTIFQRCYASNIATAIQKNLKFRIRESNVYCESDPEMLFRVVNNLVENALKYTDTGGVLVGVKRRYGGFAICVIDTGIGIPADSLDKIYDEFTMLVDSSRKSAGSGLGLTIVKRTVELLGMKIHTYSKVGTGSSFCVEMPGAYIDHTVITGPTNLKSTHGSDEDLDAPPINELNGLLVGVVDDIPDLRTAICRILERNGMRTADAPNWQELQQALQNQTPDFLITDYKLENEVTGYDVITAARKHYSKNLPCLIITGDTSPELVLNMSQRGIDICYKPLSSKKLLASTKKQLHIA